VKARVSSADKVRRVPVDRAEGAYVQILVGPDVAPRFLMRRFTLLPGGRIPKHLHPEIEHEQYVLQGTIRIGLGEKVIDVGPGDVVFIPLGTPHWYENIGDEPAMFLCMVPATQDYRTEWLD